MKSCGVPTNVQREVALRWVNNNAIPRQCGADAQAELRALGKQMYPDLPWERLVGGSWGPQLTVLCELGMITHSRLGHFRKHATLTTAMLAAAMGSSEQGLDAQILKKDPALHAELWAFLPLAAAAPRATKKGLPSMDGLPASASPLFRHYSHQLRLAFIRPIWGSDINTIAVVVIESIDANAARVGRLLRIKDDAYEILDFEQTAGTWLEQIHGRPAYLTEHQKTATSLDERLDALVHSDSFWTD